MIVRGKIHKKYMEYVVDASKSTCEAGAMDMLEGNGSIEKRVLLGVMQCLHDSL